MTLDCLQSAVSPRDSAQSAGQVFRGSELKYSLRGSQSREQLQVGDRRACSALALRATEYAIEGPPLRLRRGPRHL